MTDFCYACHGNAAPGAGTNVQSGVFDNGPTSTGGAPANGTTTFAVSNSTDNAPLNGGGFEKVGGIGGTNIQSSHMMDKDIIATPALAGILIKWGNASLAPMAKFTCNDCHDPHGSTNYRLLKDQLAGAGDMTNFVISNEELLVTGFRRGPDGVQDIQDYVPNYTSAYYAQSAAGKGMAAWCQVVTRSTTT